MEFPSSSQLPIPRTQVDHLGFPLMSQPTIGWQKQSRLSLPALDMLDATGSNKTGSSKPKRSSSVHLRRELGVQSTPRKPDTRTTLLREIRSPPSTSTSGNYPHSRPRQHRSDPSYTPSSSLPKHPSRSRQIASSSTSLSTSTSKSLLESPQQSVSGLSTFILPTFGSLRESNDDGKGRMPQFETAFPSLVKFVAQKLNVDNVNPSPSERSLIGRTRSGTGLSRTRPTSPAESTRPSYHKNARPTLTRTSSDASSRLSSDIKGKAKAKENHFDGMMEVDPTSAVANARAATDSSSSRSKTPLQRVPSLQRMDVDADDTEGEECDDDDEDIPPSGSASPLERRRYQSQSQPNKSSSSFTSTSTSTSASSSGGSRFTRSTSMPSTSFSTSISMDIDDDDEDSLSNRRSTSSHGSPSDGRDANYSIRPGTSLGNGKRDMPLPSIIPKKSTSRSSRPDESQHAFLADRPPPPSTSSLHPSSSTLSQSFRPPFTSTPHHQIHGDSSFYPPISSTPAKSDTSHNQNQTNSVRPSTSSTTRSSIAARQPTAPRPLPRLGMRGPSSLTLSQQQRKSSVSRPSASSAAEGTTGTSTTTVLEKQRGFKVPFLPSKVRSNVDSGSALRSVGSSVQSEGARQPVISTSVCVKDGRPTKNDKCTVDGSACGTADTDALMEEELEGDSAADSSFGDLSLEWTEEIEKAMQAFD